jgi:hypothetical protein
VFKYPTSDMYEGDIEYERRRHDISYSYACDCDGDPSDYYHDQCNDAIFHFFRDRKRKHYDELNNNVFVSLKDLELEYVENDVDYIMKISYTIPKDPMFYNDAKKHMSRGLRKNISKFEKNVIACNEYIDEINPNIKKIIENIIAEPIHASISNEATTEVYRIVKIGFYQAVRSVDDVAIAIRKWDLSAKVGSRDFGKDTDRTRNILGTIQENSKIIGYVKGLQRKILDLKKEIDSINNQANEIYSLIINHRYHKKRLCCPSLIKEMWHDLFF